MPTVIGTLNLDSVDFHTNGPPPPGAPQPGAIFRHFFGKIGTVNARRFTYNGVEVTDPIVDDGRADSDHKDVETDSSDYEDATDSSDYKDATDSSSYSDGELDYARRYLAAVKMQRKMRRLKKEAEAQARRGAGSPRTKGEERPEGPPGGQARRQRRLPDVEFGLHEVHLGNTFFQFGGCPSQGRGRNTTVFNIHQAPSETQSKANPQKRQPEANPPESRSPLRPRWPSDTLIDNIIIIGVSCLVLFSLIIFYLPD